MKTINKLSSNELDRENVLEIQSEIMEPAEEQPQRPPSRDSFSTQKKSLQHVSVESIQQLPNQ